MSGWRAANAPKKEKKTSISSTTSTMKHAYLLALLLAFVATSSFAEGESSQPASPSG